MDEMYYFLRFYHKGEFQKTKYSCGTCTKIPVAVEADKLSYSVIMEYVKEDAGYDEIGGVYVKKNGGGWKIISNDACVYEYAKELKNGAYLDLYIDTVVDETIEPAKEMQPHVIVRPRTKYFEGPDFQMKRKFVTIENLKQQQKDKKKCATLPENKKVREEEKKNASVKETKNASVKEKKIQSEKKNETAREKEKKTASEKEDAILPEEPNQNTKVKVADYELKRRKRMEENRKQAELLKLKEKAAELSASKSKRKIISVEEEWPSDVQFDRDYVSGHDSVSYDEEIHFIPKKKKKVPRKDVTRPRTRSCSVNIGTERPQATAGETALPPPTDLPPPPPLPVDLTKLHRSPTKNEGIGSMEAYLQLQKRKKDAEGKHMAHADNTANYEADDSNQLQPPHSTYETGETSAAIKRCRGPTKMNHVFTRRLDQRPVVCLNNEFQPVSKTNKVVAELSSFLGTIARLYIPLDFVNWSKVPEEVKNGWWDYVKTKYIIPDEGNEWVMRTLADNWRVYKSRIKARCYTKCANDEDRIKSKPPTIPLEQFKVMLKYWGNEKVQDKAAKNLANRKKVTETHNAGRTSFAQIRNKMKKAKSAGDDNITKGRKVKGKKIDETPEDDSEESDNVGEHLTESHLVPHDRVGRSGINRKSKKNLPKKVDTDSAEIVNVIREQIAAEMEEKMKLKLRMIFQKLGEMNPTLNINVEELCADSEVDADGEEDADGEDLDGDEAST